MLRAYSAAHTSERSAELDLSAEEYKRRQDAEAEVAGWYKALHNMKKVVRKQVKSRQGMMLHYMIRCGRQLSCM